MIPKLVGEKVVLRKVKQEDLQMRYELGSNDEYLKMCGKDSESKSRFDMNEAEKWFQRIQLHPSKWVIEYKTKLIGTIGIRINEQDNKGKLSIEIYDKNLYGKGIGSESINLVVDYVFNVLGLNKIYLRVLDFNERGIACYKKCGFVIEGYDREGSVIEGKYCTDIFMSILKSEYEGTYNEKLARNSFV